MVRPADVEALKQLALLGGMEGPVELASSDFSQLLHSSQQTGSRRLIELAEQDLIQRHMGQRKQRIQITDHGRDVLRAEYVLYQQLFERREDLRLRGTVKTGLGEGRYYLSRPGYQRQFEALLGWVPYPGTLNLQLDGAEATKLQYLRRHAMHTIEGFQAEGRTFGGVTAHPATVHGQTCAAILPHRSHYATTLELIAPACLRDALPCEDEDEVEVVVRLEEA